MVVAFGAYLRRWYFAFALAAWVFAPEARRIADWLTGFHKQSIWSVVPFVMLLPSLFFWKAARGKLGPLFERVAVIWVAGFAYALLIGLVISPLAALYDLASFVLPILFGILLAASDGDVKSLYERVASTMLWLAAASAAYGIYQYVAPPPWDVYWVNNSDLVSIGVPEPFGLRIFGTLNAYAALAHFIALTMAANLPRLRPSRWVTSLLFVPSTVALILTQDRTAWLAFVVGLIIYLMASPSRKNAILSLSTAIAFCAVVGFGIITIAGGTQDVGQTLQSRFASLSDVGNDTSFNDRQFQTSYALRLGASEPLGQGLGSVGTSAIAGKSGSTMTLDNGYLARFVELGFAGFALYMAALGIAAATTFSIYRATARRSAWETSALASMLGMQFMLLGMDLSTDTHSGVLGLFFWFSLFISSRVGAASLVTSREEKNKFQYSLSHPRFQE